MIPKGKRRKRDALLGSPWLEVSFGRDVDYQFELLGLTKYITPERALALKV